MVERLRNGDVTILEYLFDLYFSALARYAYLFVQNEDMAKDMVQEVFYNLWKNRKKLHIQKSLKAFLYTSVKNQCLNYLRHQEIKDQYSKSYKDIRKIEIEFRRNMTDDEVIKNETEVRLHHAIDSLSPQTRHVFNMSRFEGKRNQVIADELNISLKAVEKHITQALKKIKTFLD